MTKLPQLDLISDNYVLKLWKKLRPMTLGSVLNKNFSSPLKLVDISKDLMAGLKTVSLNLKVNTIVELEPQMP